jgi:hypothetical protein
MTSSESSFPLEARVILHGLVNAPDLNGEVGIVRSELTNGRQQVYLEDLSKSVALKLSNLQWEGRSVETLSVKELKMILKSQNTPDSEMIGVDKRELQSKVANLTDAPEEIAKLLAHGKAGTPTTARATPFVNPSKAANQLSNMSPDELRSQARMMRSMDPDSVRRMNPQLQHMSNEQLQQAANQMEMMASNPDMMKMASEQIKNMSPEEMQRMQTQMKDGSKSTNTTTDELTSGTSRESMMANMTPEQLKQQAHMLKTMDPATVRRMNPQLAHMNDEQIKMAAQQFEMMASNPEMMKMAMEQMKNLSPEQIEQMKNGTAAGPPNMNSMAGQDPAKLLANMDKGQLKLMLTSLKDNPEMLKQLKQFAGMSGLSEEQLAKGVEMFAGMEDDKLDKAVAVMVNVQKAKEVWAQADRKTGGHLKKIVVGVTILVVVLFTKWLWFSSGGGGSLPAEVADIPNILPTTIETGVEEDEFASEF